LYLGFLLSLSDGFGFIPAPAGAGMKNGCG
jgi:hypothetical protein